MRPATRGRTLEAICASVVAHVILLILIGLHSPRLMIPQEASGPPQPIIPVLILPRTPPAVAGGPPRPVRLHRRAQRTPPEELPVEPLVAEELEAPPPPAAEGPVAVAPPTPDPITLNVRQALRGSLVGCANARALGLSREEREKCDEQFAAGAKQAPFEGLGIEADKASGFGKAGVRKEQDYQYKHGSVPSGTSRTTGGVLANDRSELKIPF